METYYEKIKSRSMNNSITSEIVNISKNYHEIKATDEKAAEAEMTFGITADGYIKEMASKILEKQQVKENKTQFNTEYVTLDEPAPIEQNIVEEVPIVDVPVVEETLPPEEPPTISIAPTEETKEEVVKEESANEEKTEELKTINEDVIGKAKEIINMDIPSGSVVLDEYLKTHDPDTNKNLLETLIYIDPVAISNNISNEVDYLRVRGINVAYVQTEEQVEEQGRGR